MSAAAREMPRAFALVPTRCALCGDPRSRLVVRARDPLGLFPGEANVVSCISCGSWRVDPAPAGDDIARLYPDEYRAHHASGPDLPATAVPSTGDRLRREFAEWAASGRRSIWLSPLGAIGRLAAARLFHLTGRGRFNMLAFNGAGRRLLDVGCGAGDLLAQYAARGWAVIGVEPSAAAAHRAIARGYPIVNGTFPESSAALARFAPFSAVVMSNVIEHLPDPLAALGAARNLMEPGGLLLVTTPVTDGIVQRLLTEHWYNLDAPRHLHLFSRKNLDALLRQAGFSPIAHAPATSARAVLRTLAAAARHEGREDRAAYLESSGAVLRLANAIVFFADRTGQGDVVSVLATRNAERAP
ncbi:class I SAM-dependent methyltransferase [bacterium]|nr:class I SAM-dependent methyltransferase [bacterium]